MKAQAPGHRLDAQSPMGAKAAPSRKSASAWSVDLAEVILSGGNLRFEDKAAARPVSFEVSALQVQAKNFSLDGKKAGAVAVSARVAAGHIEPGKLDFRGAATMNPLSIQGQVNAVDLPLHAFEPYFGDALNIELLRADASFKGSMRYAQAHAGPILRLTGDTALEAFRAKSVQLQGPGANSGLQAAEELLSWRALSLRGLDVSMAPGLATHISVRDTVISDFFARVIINQSGRINLQDIVKASVPPGTSSTMAATATVIATCASSAAPSVPNPPVISFGRSSFCMAKCCSPTDSSSPTIPPT